MRTLVINTEKTNERIVNEINKFRLDNKNNWYEISLVYYDFNIHIKAFNTWLQIIRVYNDNLLYYNHSGPMDINSTKFKSIILTMLVKLRYEPVR
jgi:hypothetical protein